MASSKKIKAVDRARMILNRDERRQAREQRKEENRLWHEQRAAEARAAQVERRTAKRPTPAQERVPQQMRDADKRAAEITQRIWAEAERAPLSANKGRKVKKRKPRRREMPGAEQRRIERNRKAWTA